MTGAPISLAQQEVATILRAGLADPSGIVAVTGEAGLGKTVTVASVIRDRGLTAWFISPALEDLSVRLTLLYKAKSLSSYVLVIEDAHTFSPSRLRGIFALLARDRLAFPRVVFVARPAFWQLFEDPALAGARDCISTVAIMFPMTADEAAQFLRHHLGPAASSSWARALLREARGNPRRLHGAVAHHHPPALSRPGSRQWSAQAWSGSAALLVLVIAIALLAMSMIDAPPPVSLSRSETSPMSAHAPRP